jgi:chaperone modulatory protein CbpM
MITLDALRLAVDVEVSEVERWIGLDLVVPEGSGEARRFRSIDVARVRLILELKRDCGIDEAALPVVLSLLDQLYRTREQMRRLVGALEETLPPALKESLFDRLS